jgi:hypothetical protein
MAAKAHFDCFWYLEPHPFWDLVHKSSGFDLQRFLRSEISLRRWSQLRRAPVTGFVDTRIYGGKKT